MNNENQASPLPVAPTFNRRYLLWIILLGIFLVSWLGNADRQAGDEITYTEFKQALHQGQIAKVTLEGQHISGTYNESGGNIQPGSKDSKEFSTTRPPFDDPELMKLLEQKGVTVQAESQETSLWMQAIIGILPWFLILGLIFYVSYRMQQRMMGGGRGVPLVLARRR